MYGYQGKKKVSPLHPLISPNALIPSTPPQCSATTTVSSHRQSGSPQQLDSQTILLTAARVPQKITRLMKRAGATYSFADGLVCVACAAGDAAFEIWDNFINSQGDEDPHLTAVFAPPPGVVLPPLAVRDLLAAEVASILYYCAPLRADDFRQGLPPLPAPLAAPPLGGIRFHSAAMSCSRVIERVQNPRSALYPVITGLPVGTYICTRCSSWIGTLADVHVVRIG